ncbi:phosphate ABC superfamily ATP binding cassette transporter, permease protein [Liquorilactobacillus capillatus DSM 19910]|uniref:Phosphate transport system permease protein n=2 Tax=Liquorilactobacillus capillatus TaxID=480931 RepID=A0A0R1MD25_9LACO|nr:phosphate ABC superfamily ATP binding cassette transporter, permease protein [Liquorilactobacillus capillatus DSM 19910]
MMTALILFITYKGLQLFSQDKISLSSFLGGTKWNPRDRQFGASALLLGSITATFLAVLLAFPFALGTAIFISEFKPLKVKKYLRFSIELLVGIPAVVYGFIGIAAIVPLLRLLLGGTGFSLLAGVIILAIMILPTMTTLCVTAFKSVPSAYREVSHALGATQWQTLQKIILPLAQSQIIIAILFGTAQAFGEAIAVQMVIGNAVLIPRHLMSPAATLTSVLTTGMGDSVRGSVANNALWSLALLLLIISLLFNLAVHLTTRKRF